MEIDTDGCVRLSGPLTFESVPGLYAESKERFQGSKNLSSIDLSGVIDADSAGLALLLEWQAARRTEHGRLNIENSPSSLMRLARLCEAIELINISERQK